MALTKNPNTLDKSKHFNICQNFVQDKVEEGQVSLDKVSSKENTADILTKTLSTTTFEQLLVGQAWTWKTMLRSLKRFLDSKAKFILVL